MTLLSEQYDWPVSQMLSYGGDDDGSVILRFWSIADGNGWLGQFGSPYFYGGSAER